MAKSKDNNKKSSSVKQRKTSGTPDVKRVSEFLKSSKKKADNISKGMTSGKRPPLKK